MSAKEAREALFLFLGPFEEEDCPSFAAALDRYGAALIREQAAHLESMPHEPTALTGPYWYGQGWKDAIRELQERADYMEPGP